MGKFFIIALEFSNLDQPALRPVLKVGRARVRTGEELRKPWRCRCSFLEGPAASRLSRTIEPSDSPPICTASGSFPLASCVAGCVVCLAGLRSQLRIHGNT